MGFEHRVAGLAGHGVIVSHDVSLAPFTTYRVGGPARWFVDVGTVAGLDAVAAAVAATGVTTLVVGRGSNMLVADAGFDGLAIRLSGDFEAVEIDRTTVRAGGAAPLPVLARRTVAAGLTGFEWAVGVPGSVGGAVRMNAGGHGSDMAAALKSAELVDLSSAQRHEVEVRDLDLGYRHSNIRSDQLVAAATLELTRSSTGAGERELSEIVAWRREHQPGGANAGSVFANPEGDSAGRLIDAAGCKGLRIGSAEVSTKHANFIQADSDGSGDDVAAVMCAVRAAVREQFGVNLRAETRVVGFAPDVSEAMGASQ